MTRTLAHDVGDTQRFTVTFKDVAGAVADPTTVTFRIREPNGTLTSKVYLTDAEVIKDSTGVYHLDFAIVQAGRHAVRWEGVGVVDTAQELEFWARAKGAI